MGNYSGSPASTIDSHLWIKPSSYVGGLGNVEWQEIVVARVLWGVAVNSVNITQVRVCLNSKHGNGYG